MAELTVKQSKELEDNMDFTLESHHSERVKYHMKMLNYYLNQQKLWGGSYH